MSSTLCMLCLLALLASCSFTSVLAKKAFLARIEDAGDQNTTMHCSAAEMLRFKDHIEQGLRNEDDDDDEEDDRRMQRKLLSKCKGGCKAGNPYCRFTGVGCIASERRQLIRLRARRTDEDSEDDSEDEEGSSCTATLDSVLQRIDQVVPLLGAPCQDLVRHHGHFTCEEIVPCTITHFSLWNVATNTKTAETFSSGKSICRSANVTFEAVTNFDLGPLQFNLLGPNGLNLTKIGFRDPYFLTAGSPSNVTLQGLLLNITGSYKLHAWPENDLTKKMSTSFRLKSC